MFRSSMDRTNDVRPPTEKNAEAANVYECKICYEEYFSETEVEVHKQSAHKLNCYITESPQNSFCLVCAEGYTSRENLITHIKLAHLFTSKNGQRVEREIYICDICQRIFFHKGILQTHMNTRHFLHNRPKKADCPHCRRTIQLPSLWYHFEAKGLKSVSTCPFCFTKAGSRKSLREHVQKVHPPFFRCDICMYKTAKLVFFEHHLRKYHSKKRTEFPMAERYFTTNRINRWRYWKYRVQFILSGLNLYGMLNICVLCREICASSEEMETHMASDHVHELPKNEQLKYCHCGEGFSTNILLKHHVFKLQGEHRVLEEIEELQVDEEFIESVPADHVHL